MRSHLALVAIVVLVTWTVLMAYLYSIGVFSDDPATGGDDPPSGFVERAMYLVLWLIVAIPLVVVSIGALRGRHS